MPRGPHDREIRGPDDDTDRAKKRRDEFLRERFPEGVPPTSEDSQEDTRKPADRGRKRAGQGDERR
jgi:hypothetical protein